MKRRIENDLPSKEGKGRYAQPSSTTRVRPIPPLPDNALKNPDNFLTEFISTSLAA